MGIYDRDYNRAPYGGPGPTGFHVGGPLTLTTKLVLVMFGVYAVQLVTRPENFKITGDLGWFTTAFELRADLFRRPWMAFELLTYGFLHSPGDIYHILFNMFGLWLFGRGIEERYGPREYLTFVLAAIVFAGLFWVLGELVANRGQLANTAALGASGGVVAVLILFAFLYPHRTVLFMFVIPMPMWVLGLIIIGLDIKGAFDRAEPTAFTAHLGGALFAALYYKSGARLARWLPDRSWLTRLRSRPRLRVHHPDEESNDDSQVDEILRKIQEHGQDSLTRRERRILEQASREFQKRRSE